MCCLILFTFIYVHVEEGFINFMLPIHAIKDSKDWINIMLTLMGIPIILRIKLQI